MSDEDKPTDASGPLSAVYDELRGLARSYLARERANHTLQPTALVHEAFLRLTERDPTAWESERHFLAIAAGTMRQVLVDSARRRGAEKRGGDRRRVTLSDVGGDAGAEPVDVLDLDAALTRLAAISPRRARMTEMRYFGGMSGSEIAEVLGASRRTVVRELAAARLWLLAELDEEKGRP